MNNDFDCQAGGWGAMGVRWCVTKGGLAPEATLSYDGQYLLSGGFMFGVVGG